MTAHGHLDCIHTVCTGCSWNMLILMAERSASSTMEKARSPDLGKCAYSRGVQVHLIVKSLAFLNKIHLTNIWGVSCVSSLFFWPCIWWVLLFRNAHPSHTQGWTSTRCKLLLSHLEPTPHMGEGTKSIRREGTQGITSLSLHGKIRIYASKTNL